MTDRKPRTPSETMRAIEAQAAEDAIAAVTSMNEAEVDAELRARGVDPAEAERRAQAAIEAALASVPAGGARPAARAPRAIRWSVAVPALAAAAAVVVVVGVKRDAIVAALGGGGESIGPDTVGTGAPSHAPTMTAAQTQAKALRETAFAACKEGYLVDCEKDLDDAKALDPAGEALPEVLAARRQVSVLPPPDAQPK